MDTTRVLGELREERERIAQAITVLESLGSNRLSTGARTARAGGAAVKQKGRQYRISASGRRRNSETAKAIWVERKDKARSRAMSAASRKRLSELAKQKWAKRKKKAKPA